MTTEKLREALQGLLNIVNDSRGVAGYHLNGDIAEWDEFDEVNVANEALAQPSPPERQDRAGLVDECKRLAKRYAEAWSSVFNTPRESNLLGFRQELLACECKKLHAAIDALAAQPATAQELDKHCAQCKAPYRPKNKGCPKCAPGVRVSEAEFREPIKVSPQQPATAPAQADLERECDAVDYLLTHLGLDPERCRTDGGAINLLRIKSLLADAAPAQAVGGEVVAWKWENVRTGAKGVYFEDPKQFHGVADHPEYIWTNLYTAQPAGQERVKCDGNHGGPRCADPECWNDDASTSQEHPQQPTRNVQAAADHVAARWANLYYHAHRLVEGIRFHGEISSKCDAVEQLEASVYALDGGEYKHGLRPQPETAPDHFRDATEMIHEHPQQPGSEATND